MEDEDLFTYGVHGSAGGDAQEVEDLGCEDVEAAESLADDDCEVQEDQLPPVGPTSGPEGQEPAARGRGNGRERGRGPRGINKSREGSVVGRGKWSFQSWVRLVHAVTEDMQAFRQITQGFERHELDSGTNPWDRICEVYNDPTFQPTPHKVACLHPDLRSADPSALLGKGRVTTCNLMDKWKTFKGHVTKWHLNWGASGNNDVDKADFAVIGTCESVLISRYTFILLVQLFMSQEANERRSSGASTCGCTWM